MEEERLFIDVEDEYGKTGKIELITEVKSKRDDKTYVLLTPDKEINDEINVSFGHVFEKDGRLNLELIEDEEEINYICSLIEESLTEA